MSDNKSEKEELEALRKHNAELLGKLRAVKDKLEESNNAIAQLAEENESIKSKMNAVVFEKPVNDVLSELFLIDPAISLQQVRLHYDVEYDQETDAILITDKEGKALSIKAEVDGREVSKEVEFNKDDLYQLFSERGGFDEILIASRASGGGASPSSYAVETNAASQKRSPDRGRFGLR